MQTRLPVSLGATVIAQSTHARAGRTEAASRLAVLTPWLCYMKRLMLLIAIGAGLTSCETLGTVMSGKEVTLGVDNGRPVLGIKIPATDTKIPLSSK